MAYGCDATVTDIVRAVNGQTESSPYLNYPVSLPADLNDWINAARSASRSAMDNCLPQKCGRAQELHDKSLELELLGNPVAEIAKAIAIAQESVCIFHNATTVTPDPASCPAGFSLDSNGQCIADIPRPPMGTPSPESQKNDWGPLLLVGAGALLLIALSGDGGSKKKTSYRGRKF